MVINPNTTPAITDTVVAAALASARSNTVLVGSTAARGVASVECSADEAIASVAVLEQVRAGEAAGTDGYVIACFGDTGVAAAKEIAAGPVVGMTEAALLTAAVIAERFAVVTLPPRTVAMAERVVHHLGLGHRCRVRAVDVRVADIASSADDSLGAVGDEAAAAVADDRAEAVVLGCAGLAELVEPLTDRLGVPVIDGVAAAVAMVEGLLAQKLTTFPMWSCLPPR